MGILPLELIDAGPDDLAPTGAEEITITGLTELAPDHVQPMVTITSNGNRFAARARLDTPREIDYFRHGGVMPYVLRGLLTNEADPIRRR
jgi:aconitate hydratase